MEYWKLAIIIILPISGVGIFISFDLPAVENEIDVEPIMEIGDKQTAFKIGTVHRDASKMVKRFQPTANYLADKLSNEEQNLYGKVVIVKTVEEMIQLLQKQEIDLYFESPLTSMTVSLESDSTPFLIRWKEQAESYHSVFFVEKNSTIQTIDDFIGKTIVFQSPESTSGYLLPLSHLHKNNITVGLGDNFDINYVFSNDDENTPNWVLSETGSIGVVSNQDFEDFPDNIKSQITIIESTQALPRQLVSHKSTMNEDTIIQIENILLSMHKDPEGSQILDDFKHTSKYSKIQNKGELFSQLSEILESIRDRS